MYMSKPAEVAAHVFWSHPNRITRHEREVAYQAFKARIMEEIAIETPDPRTINILVPKPAE